MNMFPKVIFSFALCYVVGILPAYAEISNHQIFYRQDERAPLTRVDIVFLGAGSNQEPPSQIGLALTVSKLIWESGKKQGYIDQLAVLGTDLNIFADITSLTISISTLSENCAESIEIVYSLIHNLEFSESDLEDVKKLKAVDYQNYLKRYASYLMHNFALAQTWGIKKLRSLETLKNLSVKDVRQYYARLLKTEVVFFKVLSDRDSTEIAQILRPITEEREKLLIQQAGGFVHSLAHPAVNDSADPSAFVFDSNIKSVFCSWLIPCGMRGEEDVIPLMISRALGGTGAQGLLFKYFRKELGLIYGIGCSYQSSENVRFLVISADPRLQNAEELIGKMSNFIRELPDNPRFWEAIKELRESRNVAYAHFHEQRTPQRRLDNEVYRAIYNPPRRKGGYDSVTDAEVRSFLEKFFVSENMVMIFTGPKDNIRDILNKHWPEAEVHEQNRQSLLE